MSKVLITDTYLTNIADSIREQTDTSATYTPSTMSAAIDDMIVYNGELSSVDEATEWFYKMIGGEDNLNSKYVLTLSSLSENANAMQNAYYGYLSNATTTYTCADVYVYTKKTGIFVEFNGSDSLALEDYLVDSSKMKSNIFFFEEGLACFSGDTLVSTPQGLIPIEELKAGDEVYTFDLKTNEKVVGTIGNVNTHEGIEYFHVINNDICVTGDHPIYMLEGHLCRAEDIREDMTLFNDIPVDFANYIKADGAVTGYDLQLEGYVNYYVGEDEILVRTEHLLEED